MVTAPARQRGVTYLALLLAIAMVSGVLAASASVVSQAQRREREQQLLWAGEQFRRALASYARTAPGGFPDRLEDLLDDPRTPTRRRHLRMIYDDPMTRGTDWGLIRNEKGGIIAVHSRSMAAPIKRGRFPTDLKDFEKARSYVDWKFAAFAPPAATPDPASGAPNPARAASGAAVAASGPAAAAAPATPASAGAAPAVPATNRRRVSTGPAATSESSRWRLRYLKLAFWKSVRSTARLIGGTVRR